MKRCIYLTLMLSVALSACSKNDTHKCSDTDSLEILTRIILEQVQDRESNLFKSFNEKELKDNILFEYIRAVDYNEKIKKFDCVATLVIPAVNTPVDLKKLKIKYTKFVEDPYGNVPFSPAWSEVIFSPKLLSDRQSKFSLNIQYESQLDDKNEHIIILKDFSDNFKEYFLINRPISLKLFENLVTDNLAPAQITAIADNLKIGISYFDSKNYEAAFKILAPLASQGNVDASGLLSRMYVNGWGVPKNYDEAYKLAKFSSTKGNSDGENTLGSMYADGLKVNQDYKEAIKWFRLSAAQSNAQAQTNLGYLYRNGFGVNQDYNEALKWYKLAAAQKDVGAEFNLGLMYTNGYGVLQDYNEALKWYKLAAAQNDAGAEFNLGYLYENGFGVNQDFKEAIKWYKLAETGMQDDNNKAYVQKKLASLINNQEAKDTNVTNSANSTLSVQDKANPSFDCNKAESPSELLICNDQELSKLDRDYALIFRQAKSKALDGEVFTKQTKDALKRRETNCRDKECLVKWYSERSSALNEIIQEATSKREDTARREATYQEEAAK